MTDDNREIAFAARVLFYAKVAVSQFLRYHNARGRGGDLLNRAGTMEENFVCVVYAAATDKYEAKGHLYPYCMFSIESN